MPAGRAKSALGNLPVRGGDSYNSPGFAMQQVVFFSIVTLFWIAAHAYLGRRLIVGSELRGRARRLAWVAVAVAAALPPLSIAVGRSGPGLPGAGAWQLLGFFSMGLSSMLFVFVLTADVLRLSARGVAWVARRRAADGPPIDPSRRSLLGGMVNLGMVGTAGSLAGVGYVQAISVPDVVEVDVPIEGLPEALQGFRIVQLTDIHIGPTIRRDYLAAVVDVANALKPDVVAVTGDLVDGHVPELREHVAPLRRLRARHGRFFVTGNHEYYWNAPAWCEEVGRLGLQVLNNAHAVIERDGAKLLVAGCTDHRAGSHVAEHASDPAAAKAGAPPCDAEVLLAHQPRSVYAAAKAGYDLQISGHTHGGQYFPMNLLVYLAQPYVAGLAKHLRTWIYVSRGTGYWGPPMRVGAPHEITLLRLVAA